ncbi:DUF1217 domain-containing protein [Novispirillum sp. DQ9]|uniref:DUF1217 domain-containing protein n=1 Tax=Novispirillum sp. DQ9 TaxID=3398612 RepID=UPI003C7ECC89
MISELVSGFGTSSFAAFRTINSRLDQLKTTFVNQPEIKRDVDYIRSNIAKVENVDDLMDDYKLWQSVATAFGLGDNAFAKGLFKKLLTEDSSKPESLVNRLVDPRYKELAKFFQMDTKGTANFKDASWVNKLVDKYTTRTFESEAGAGNPAVQSALYFQRKAPEITSYYQILADDKLYEVVRHAVGLPDSFARVDVDRQAEMLKSKFSLDDLKNPAKLGRMVERHLAIADAETIQSGSSLGNSTGAMALQIFSASRPMSGFGSILQIDPTLFLKK